MDKLTVAINRVHETLDALRTAITELEIETSIINDRLRRILDDNGQVEKGHLSTGAEERLCSRPRPLDYIAWGDTAVVNDTASPEAKEKRRLDARFGRPLELRDII